MFQCFAYFAYCYSANSILLSTTPRLCRIEKYLQLVWQGYSCETKWEVCHVYGCWVGITILVPILRLVSSLNNPQNSEMNYCENMKLTCRKSS